MNDIDFFDGLWVLMESEQSGKDCSRSAVVCDGYSFGPNVRT